MEKFPPAYPQHPYVSAPPPPAAYYPPGPPPPAAYYPPPQGIVPPYMQGAGAPAQWTTGLCDCFDDAGNCFITCLLPCITFGQIAEIVDKGANSCGTCGAVYGLICAFTGCQFIWSCIYRTKMREQYNLAGDSCYDCCVHCCCEPCAICQEYRELKNRGIDPSLGWAGNLAKQATTGVPVPPPVQGGMTRY